MDLEPVIDRLSALARDAAPRKDGDFEVDGLLYCGVCGEPRQMVFGESAFGPFSGRKVYCACRCYREKLEAIRREKQKEAAENRRRAAFSVPALRQITFARDDDPEGRLSKLCRRYVAHFDEMLASGRGLLLYGSVGVGKTFYAVCIANALIDRGRRVFFTSFSELGQDGIGRLAQEADRADLLVIDDFGAERDSSYMEEVVHRIINVRALSKKPLLITTNLDAEQFEYPDSLHRQRIFSRLCELCLPFRCTGNDKRKQRLRADFDRLKTLLEE